MVIFPNNKHHNYVWLKAAETAVKKQPSDITFYIHAGVKELAAGNIKTFGQRHNIFQNFSLAAESGDARGIFFESLCWRHGFGRDLDLATGNALLQVAAIARESDLAINYLYLHLGLAYLYGQNNIQQNYRQAIQFLLKAGELATPEREALAEHFRLQELRQIKLRQQSKFSKFTEPYRPKMPYTRLNLS